MPSVQRSLLFTLVERYILLAMNIAAFTLLARWLTPSEIGLFAVSMAIISVAQVLRDFGLANFLIQRPELSKDELGSAIGLSMLLGGGLFVIAFACAPLAADFYKNPELTGIVRLISVNFLILPFNSVSIALLRRDMRFDRLAPLNLVSGLASTTCTLTLASQGAGTWSLAVGEIAGSLALAAGLAATGAVGRLTRPQLGQWRAILSFGGPTTVAGMVTTVSIDLNDLVVGRVLGLSQVAILSRAQGLMNLFHRDIMGAIRTVAFPAFAQAFRKNEAPEDKFLHSVSLLTVVAWPFYGFMALFSLEIIRLMFGNQWDGSAPLVPFFCLAGALSAIVSLAPTFMLAAGHAHLVSIADLIIQPIRAAVLVGLALSFKSLAPLAMGAAGMAAIAVPYFYFLKQRRMPTDFGSLLKGLWGSALVSATSLAIPFLVAWRFRTGAEPLPLPVWLACGLMTIATWLLALRLTRHPMYGELVKFWHSKRHRNNERQA